MTCVQNSAFIMNSYDLTVESANHNTVMLITDVDDVTDCCFFFRLLYSLVT